MTEQGKKTIERIKKEYGGVKAAIQHCIDLNLSLSEAAFQLDCSRDFLRVREKLYGINIRRKKNNEISRTQEGMNKRTLRGRALKYMADHGVDLSDPEAIFRAEKWAGMR